MFLLARGFTIGIDTQDTDWIGFSRCLKFEISNCHEFQCLLKALEILV